MDKFSDLLVDKSLHGFGTGQRDVIRFEFHDVIYHKEPCNVGNRRCNVDFAANGRSKCM